MTNLSHPALTAAIMSKFDLPVVKAEFLAAILRHDGSATFDEIHAFLYGPDRPVRRSLIESTKSRTQAKLYKGKHGITITRIRGGYALRPEASAAILNAIYSSPSASLRRAG